MIAIENESKREETSENVEENDDGEKRVRTSERRIEAMRTGEYAGEEVRGAERDREGKRDRREECNDDEATGRRAEDVEDREGENLALVPSNANLVGYS